MVGLVAFITWSDDRVRMLHVRDVRSGRGGTRPREWRPGGLRHSGSSA